MIDFLLNHPRICQQTKVDNTLCSDSQARAQLQSSFIIFIAYIYVIISEIITMQGQNDDAFEELNCSVCMCLFVSPITIECGHTFCKFCLNNSLGKVNSCPMCRKALTFVSNRQQEDQTISKIVEHIQQNQRRKIQEKEKEISEIQRIVHFQDIFLLDIFTDDLLLPFTSVKATFQLQSPTLFSRLDNFVARQKEPFNRYGILAKLTNIKQLNNQIYECIIEGKNFCQIKQSWEESNADDNIEFFYRLCRVDQIYQQYQFNSETFKPFYDRLSKMNDKKKLQKVYQLVNHEKLFQKTDSIPAYYSIMKVLAIPDQEKYKIITTFNKQEREDHLKKFFKQFEGNQTKSKKFLSVDHNPNFPYYGAFAIFAFFIFYYLFLSQQV